MTSNTEKIEFRPNVFATPTVVIFIFVIVIFSIFGFTILPKAYNLYNELPGPDSLQILIVSLIGTILPPLFFMLIVWLNTRGKTILLDGKLLYFNSKSLFKSGESKIFNLEQVEHVGYRKQVIPIFTGKTMVVITRFWFIFFHKDGHKEEASLDGWDIGTLKNLIFFIRGKFPNVKWNTHIYQDSPEVLSGINEYLDKAK